MTLIIWVMLYESYTYHDFMSWANGGSPTRNKRTVRSFQCALTFRIKCSRMSLNKYAFYTSRKLLETAWSACFEVTNHENYFANEFWLTTNKTPAVESINMVSHWLPISRWPPPAVVSRHKPQLRINSHKWLANQNREDAESDFDLNVTLSAWMRQIGMDSRVVQGQIEAISNPTHSTECVMVIESVKKVISGLLCDVSSWLKTTKLT